MLNELYSSLDFIILQTKNNGHYLLIIFLVYWGFYFLSVINKNILYLGIIPRNVYGLAGIIFSPLLHANFNHLFFNTIPLLVLSDFILVNGIVYYLAATIAITVISGFLIWCFAKPGLHIGASGLITGYWGLLVINILHQGTFTALILGVISLYYFAGIFLGIFPREKGVSWEGHLFGLCAGVLVGYTNFILENTYRLMYTFAS